MNIKTWLRLFIGPKHQFDGLKTRAPDYDNPSDWAEIPTHPNNDKLTIENCPESLDPKADVFFVHPTTYVSKASWNAPLNHKRSRKFVDQRVIKGQASVFCGAANIYAPR